MPAISTKKELPFNELFVKFILASKRGKRLQPNGKKISAGTVANYGYTLGLVKKFCAEKQFGLRIRPGRKLNARELETEKNYWKKFYKRFTDYLYEDCGYFDNYVGQNVKNLRTFFNYLNKDLAMGVGDFHKLFYVRKEEIAIFPLMPEELNFLVYNKDFENALSPRMQQVKDFFVFGCTVALRFSDLIALKPSNIRSVNGQYYLIARSIKTNTDTLVKLPPYAVDIINKYSKQKKRLLPAFNKVNLNKFIKLLLEKAGFTQPVSITRGKRGKTTELKRLNGSTQHHRFCDVATTHTMRRTAITTMLSLGVPEQVVRKISGHAPGSKEFYRYVFWAQTYQDQEVDKMFARLEEKKMQTA
ncbi:MAG: tyrosine-type recombinase/integrase [Chitinophagaceae bacterium]|nr:tyrosine-type recombinase/integrase [Chitinophagaceae bacterium]